MGIGLCFVRLKVKRIMSKASDGPLVMERVRLSVSERRVGGNVYAR